MPIVVASLKPSTLAEIQRLVDAGQYASVAEFVELAAANQLELEKGSPQPVAGESAPEPKLRTQPQVARVLAAMRPRREVTGTSIRIARSSKVEGDDEALINLRLPAAFEWPAQLPAKPPPPPTEGWVWGQVNRLLPLKVGLRWLALRSAREGAWPPVDQVLDPLGADAAAVGTLIEQADADSDRARDELLATGLPRRGNPLSVDRFISQYLARTTRKGVVHAGAAMQYGLAFMEQDRVALSSTGVEFATLRNPVLDGALDAARETLSGEERAFFARRAVPQVPTELRDFALVADLVGRGHNTPKDLLGLHRQHLPDWSDTMVRTHVTGVIARMVDLGLLQRVWQGRFVEYQTLPLAEEVKALAQEREVHDA